MLCGSGTSIVRCGIATITIDLSSRHIYISSGKLANGEQRLRGCDSIVRACTVILRGASSLCHFIGKLPTNCLSMCGQHSSSLTDIWLDFNYLGITIRQRLCEALYAAGHTKEGAESLLEMVNIFDEEVHTRGPIIKWISGEIMSYLLFAMHSTIRFKPNYTFQPPSPCRHLASSPPTTACWKSQAGCFVLAPPAAPGRLTRPTKAQRRRGENQHYGGGEASHHSKRGQEMDVCTLVTQIDCPRPAPLRAGNVRQIG